MTDERDAMELEPWARGENDPSVPSDDRTLEELLRRVSGVEEPLGTESLIWRRSGLVKKEFELLRGDRVAGDMYKAREKKVSARAECFGHPFAFKSRMTGLGGRRIRILEGDSPVASFKGSSFRRGMLKPVDGDAIRWKSRWTGTSPRTFRDPRTGELILRFRKVHFQGRLTVRVELTPFGLEREDLPLLIATGFYLCAQAESEGMAF